MSNNSRLAIVIPAYKLTFFEQALKSIASQTCKDFTLYIGDDASPQDFRDIVNSFKDRIDIVYKRFESNLGGADLVGHWNRCLKMVKDEEWIWLFSDDDLMDENCVELFYNHIERHKDSALVHFDIQVVNEKNANMYKSKLFKPNYSSSEYFSQVIQRKIFSTVVEYIFKKDVFYTVNGFQPFDLAWCSDNATWMKLAQFGGINTIEGAQVYWRVSSMNISSVSDNKGVTLRKINANVNFLNWAKLFISENNLVDDTSDVLKIHWLLITIVYTSSLSFREKYHWVRDSIKRLEMNNSLMSSVALWLYLEFKREFKQMISYKGY